MCRVAQLKMANEIEERPKHRGTWVQTERSAHEAWDSLINKHPAAARLMHRLVANMDRRGAVVISQKLLAEMMGVHRNTIGKAVKVLTEDNWIDTVQIGGQKGGVKAYLVNRRVAWADKRENQKYAIFDARVIASVSEQTENPRTDDLKQLPRAGEFQLPTGTGLAPPSQPILPDCEPDLPAINDEEKPRKIGVKEKAREIKRKRIADDKKV